MTEDIQKLERIVDALNEAFMEQTGDEGEIWRPFSLRAEGNGQNIGFFEYPIWMSQDDEREMLPEETFEPVETFIKRRITSLLQQWAKVDFGK